jgi:hypothetical protein
VEPADNAKDEHTFGDFTFTKDDLYALKVEAKEKEEAEAQLYRDSVCAYGNSLVCSCKALLAAHPLDVDEAKNAYIKAHYKSSDITQLQVNQFQMDTWKLAINDMLRTSRTVISSLVALDMQSFLVTSGIARFLPAPVTEKGVSAAAPEEADVYAEIDEVIEAEVAALREKVGKCVQWLEICSLCPPKAVPVPVPGEDSMEGSSPIPAPAAYDAEPCVPCLEELLPQTQALLADLEVRRRD